MPEYGSSTPVSVVRQETQPSASDYVFWVKASTNETFFSDGSTWTEIQTSTGGVLIPMLENSLAILEIQAADTLTAGTSAAINNEVFSDSGGYLNRVNTTNTTSFFNTNKYQNSSGTAAQNDSVTTLEATDSVATSTGLLITVNADCGLVSVTKSSNCTGTRAKLITGTSVLATASFSGDVATFATPQLLSAGTTYGLYVDNSGASYTRSYHSSDSFPFNSTNINITNGTHTDDTSNTLPNSYNIQTITTSTYTGDLIVETNEQTLASTPANFQVFAYKPSTAGTGSIDCDISFDSGANYQTGVALNTATAITDTGTGMILKLNLNAGASAGTAEAQGYGVLYW